VITHTVMAINRDRDQ